MLTLLLNEARRALGNEKGAELLEIMVGIVVIVLIAILPMQNLGSTLTQGFTKIINQLSTLVK
jgi:Flp pilus assembly pilin Flp